MADVGVCNPRGCYGRCPTSTICSRGGCCSPRNCGFSYSCGCDCIGKMTPVRSAGRTKDYINVIHQESIVQRLFYAMLRSMKPLPNKLSQIPPAQRQKLKKKIKHKSAKKHSKA